MAEHKYIKDYPRPQFVREPWMNLNGDWDFRFDDDGVGERENWPRELRADRKITVPFTYETKASGIGDETFHPVVWYQRMIAIPQEYRGKRAILHFQAVDYQAKVWVNGHYVGMHEGGYAAFSFDITPCLSESGENRLVVKVTDSPSTVQPRGKQRWIKDNFGCWYVQTTGIWQTVWMEFVEPDHIRSVKITPKFDEESVRFDFVLPDSAAGSGRDLQLVTGVYFEGKRIRETRMSVERARFGLELDLRSEEAGEWKIKPWHPDHPNLYDVKFVLLADGREADRVHSYFGMRKISIENGKILLNNAPIYQRLLLDQGYWADTHLTPPSEEAILEDIEHTRRLGFNGVRKHQKIEDARYLYWCDRKGLLVWSEMGAAYEFHDEAVDRFTREWLDLVQQFYNHPCIITWVPFNESWGIPQVFTDRKQQHFTESIYHLTKALDPYRPVVVNDGWEHTVSDILTLHDYEEDGDRFLARYSLRDEILGNRIPFNNGRYAFARGYEYRGQPVIISEYGGIAFKTDAGWGYGNHVKDEEEFIERYRKITNAIKATPYVCGFCYTQITDVQQETNGLLTEGRKPKVDPDKIRAVNLA